VTERCDPDAPHLVTHVETTPATTPDWNMLAPIHTGLAQQKLLPAEHVLDAGYVSSEEVVRGRDEFGVTVVGPVPPDNSWQARAGQGFDIASFGLDWDARRATCPHGATSVKWSATHDKRGGDVINIRFPAAVCRACPDRARCTSQSNGPREITVRPRAQHEVLQAARQHQQTAAFKARYDARAGVEGTLAQGLRVCDLRRARYIGLGKTRLQHILTVTGLNVRRLGAWWDERPFAPTRRAAFVALAA
jgi:transposase